VCTANTPIVKFSRLLRGHPQGWALVSTLLLTAGYADLWRGGTDVATILLVSGYLVAVPLAILSWNAKPAGRTRSSVTSARVVDATGGDGPRKSSDTSGAKDSYPVGRR
jgi:hypothetical protein